MEENILKLCEELDKEKSENSATDFKPTRLIKIKQFVENISEYGSLEKSHGFRPCSCKFCDKSFFQVREVKEHIKIHNSILELEDLKSQVKTLETQVEELKVQLKNSQKNEFKKKAKMKSKQKIPEPEVDLKFKKSKSKLASQTRQKKKFEKDAKIGDKQETPEPGVDQEILNDNLDPMNQLKKEKNENDKKGHCRKVHEPTLEESTTEMINVKGKEPYSCSYCDKNFTRKQNLYVMSKLFMRK